MALVYCGSGLVLGGIGWLIGAWACDEGCGGSSHWSENTEAWQWEVISTLALCVMALVIFFLIAALAGQLRIAAFCFAAQVGATIVTYSFLIWGDTSWANPQLWLLLVGAEATGVLSLLAGSGRLGRPSGP